MAERDPDAAGGPRDGEPGQLSAEHRAWLDGQTNAWPGTGQQSWLESDEVWPDSHGQSWPGGEDVWPADSPRGWPSENAAAFDPGPGEPGSESTGAWIDSLLAESSTAAPAPDDGTQPGPADRGVSEPGAVRPDTGPPDRVSWASAPAAPAGEAQPGLGEPDAAQPGASPQDPVSWASEPAAPVAEPRDTDTGQPGDSQPASDLPATTGSGSAQASDAQAAADETGQRGGQPPSDSPRERGQAGIPAETGPRDAGPSAGSVWDPAGDVAVADDPSAGAAPSRQTRPGKAGTAGQADGGQPAARRRSKAGGPPADFGRPGTVQPAETQPDGTQPDGTQPDGTQPDGTQPDKGQPGRSNRRKSTRTGETQPAETELAAEQRRGGQAADRDTGDDKAGDGPQAATRGGTAKTSRKQPSRSQTTGAKPASQRRRTQKAADDKPADAAPAAGEIAAVPDQADQAGPGPAGTGLADPTGAALAEPRAGKPGRSKTGASGDSEPGTAAADPGADRPAGPPRPDVFSPLPRVAKADVAGPGVDESSEAGPDRARSAADEAGAGRPSVFEPWSAETGWPGVPEPGESGAGTAGPGVHGFGGSRASLFEPRSTDGPGLDFGPWADGLTPDGGTSGFAQPGWPPEAEPDSPVARASWLDTDPPARPGADPSVNLFRDAGPAAGQEPDSGFGLFGTDGLSSAAPATDAGAGLFPADAAPLTSHEADSRAGLFPADGVSPAAPATDASAGLFPADAGPLTSHDTDSGGGLFPAGARYPAGPEAGPEANLFRPDAGLPASPGAGSGADGFRADGGPAGGGPAGGGVAWAEPDSPAANGISNGAHAQDGAWPWRDVQPGREQPPANGRPHGPGPAGTAAAHSVPGGSRVPGAPQRHPGSGLNLGAGMLAGAAGVLGAAASRIRAWRPDPDPPRAPGTRRRSRLPLGRNLRAKTGSTATSATAFPPPVAIPPRAAAPPPAAELLSLADGRTLAPPRPDGLVTSPGHKAVPLPADLLAPAPASAPGLPVAPAAAPEITATATFDVWSPARPALPGEAIAAPATTEPPATTTAPAAPIAPAAPATEQPGTGPEPPGTEPAEPQPSFRRRAGLAAARQARNLLALALYFGLSLGLFGHLILSHMDQRIMSAQPQDGVLFVWAFKWWPFAAAHHLPLFYTNFDWAPAGVNLTWATTIPGPSFLLSWLTNGHTAFFSFNMVELAAPALAAWTAYLLCRRITRAFFPSLIGGFFFGFSASLMDEVGQGHPSLTLVFLAPVAAYLIYRLLEKSIHPLLFMPLFAAVLYFQLTIGTEVFATMSVVGLLCALVLMAFGPNRRRITLLKAIPPVAGAYLIAMAACWPLLHAAFFGPRIDKAIHFNTIGYGAKNGSEFLRYLTPGRYSIFWGQFNHQWGDNPWYLGVPLILVILAFLITEWRRRATWAVFAGFIVILAFSLGDQMPGFPGSIEPWGLLSSIPMLSIAQPGRLVTYAFLLVAVLVAMWLAQAKRPWLIPLRWLLVLAAAVMALPNFSVDVWTQVIPVPTFFTSNHYQKYIDRGQIVWIVSTHPSRQLTWQAGTDFYFRLAGGFFGGVPTGGPAPQPVDDWKEERLAIGQVVRPDTTIDDIRFFLAEHHVSVIVAAEARWPIVHEIQRALGAFGTKVDDVRVFRLGERFTNPVLFDRPYPVLGKLIAQRKREQRQEWLRRHHQAPQIAGAGPATGAPPPPPAG